MFQVVLSKLDHIVVLNSFILSNSNHFLFFTRSFVSLSSENPFYVRSLLEINGIYDTAVLYKINTIIKNVMLHSLLGHNFFKKRPKS